MWKSEAQVEVLAGKEDGLRQELRRAMFVMMQQTLEEISNSRARKEVICILTAVRRAKEFIKVNQNT